MSCETSGGGATRPEDEGGDRRIHVRTLGTVEAVAVGGPAAGTRISFGKPLALLVYLAAAPGRAASRDELTDLLWSDSDPQRARASLRQVIFQLRQIIGTPSIATQERDVHLAVAVEADHEQFTRAIADGRLGAAVDLYRGDFLPNAVMPGAGSFEMWASLRREVLRSMFLRALEGVIRERLDAGRHSAAIRFAYRLRDVSPLRESSWRTLIETLVASGERAAAGLEADALEHTLRADDREPEPATIAVLRLVRQVERDTEDVSTSEFRCDLVGRHSQFAQLVGAWQDATRGRARRVALVAGAGMGKSRLLTDFAARLRTLRARVVQVRAHPGERDLEYAMAGELVRALASKRGAIAVSPGAMKIVLDLAPSASSLATRQDAPEPAAGSAALHSRIAAVTELVQAVSAESPLAILIDDLHWADAASRQLVASLVARVDGHAVLVAWSSRDETSLWAADDIVKIDLPSLTPDEVRELLTSVAQLPDQAWAAAFSARLHASTSGSPFRVVEALRRSLANGVLRIADETFVCDSPDALVTALSLSDAVDAQLAQLSDGSLRVLRLLSVGGTPLSTDDLAAALGAERAEVVAWLNALATLCLATTAGEKWLVAHDEIADVVSRSINAFDRKTAHIALGMAFLRGERWTLAECRRAARHLLEANDLQTLGDTFRRFVARERASGSRMPADALARELVGSNADARTVAALLRALPVRVRFRRTAAALASVLVVAAGSIGAVNALAPARLSIDVAPTQTGPDRVDGGLALYPQPVVSLHGVLRGVVRSDQDSVVARVAGGPMRLTGDTVVPVVGGMATFERLGVLGPDTGAYAVTFATRRTSLTTTVALPGMNHLDPPRLQLVRGQFGARRVSRALDTLVVAPGAIVEGTIETRYYTLDPVATTVLGLSPTWGNRARSVQRLSYLVKGPGTRSREDTVRLRAPSAPGRYYVILAFGYETDVDFLFSATNWTIGQPEWGDANDLAALPPDSIEAFARRQTASVPMPRLLHGTGPRVLAWLSAGFTAITVIVR